MIPDILVILLVGVCWFVIGFGIGVGKRTPINTEDINNYISKNFPNLWTAYKKGVTEGYEQGLRDGQDIGHESA